MIRQKLLYYQRYSGLAAIGILWAGVTVGMHRTGLGLIDKRPISYLGVAHASQMLFTLTLLASAILFLDFAYFVTRSFHTTYQFKLYFLIGQLGQIIAALVPDSEGRYKLVHTVAAFILAFSLPFLIRQFARSEADNRYGHLYRQLQQIEVAMFIIGISLFIFTRGVAPLGEALPAVGFHIWVVALTVTSLKKYKRQPKNNDT